MNNLTLVSLVLVVLSATSQCNCRKNENFLIIYGSRGEVFLKDSRVDSVSKKLTSFNGTVTGLELYKDFLYVSVMSNHSIPSSSAIWKIKVKNLSSYGMNDILIIILHAEYLFEYFVRHKIIDVASSIKNLKNSTKEILSMTIAKDYIFAGFNDGSMWRCSIVEPYSCENFDKLNGPVTKISYSIYNDNLYTVSNGRINRCSPFFPNSCQIVIENSNVTVVKATFDVLWLGTKTAQLWKCSLDDMDKNSAAIEKNCLKFAELDPVRPMEISVSKKSLYVYVETSKYVLQCDPEKTESCSKAIYIPTTKKMGPFITY